MKKRIAVIGAGVSGLTAAQCLKDKFDVTVFEKDAVIGGLIKCRNVNGSLFHTCGGHVFNSKRADVLEWFWNRFSQDQEFHKADRNAAVLFEEDSIVPYPIENHIYYLGKDHQASIVADLLELANNKGVQPQNFEEFLRNRFGESLYELYFKPYNEKVWRCSLDSVPLGWLEGKLPMPTVEEIILANFNHEKEKKFVHSSFWYENEKGSQLIVDRLSEGLHIVCNADTSTLGYENGTWIVMGETFDSVIFCGNIKSLIPSVLGIDLSSYYDGIEALSSHGTTSVFCEIDANPYSWIYLPNTSYRAHRIICTGNFSDTNNSKSVPEGRITATIEFTDEVSKDEILLELEKIPYHPVYMDHVHNKYTYPIQDADTKQLITSVQKELNAYGMYLCGRFAEWEYYNMDVAMGAARDLCERIIR